MNCFGITNAMTCAKYILNYCIKKKKPINNLKLQLLLYFLWIEFYKKTGKILFDDKFLAFPFGPCIADVYYEYCTYGGLPITDIQKL